MTIIDIDVHNYSDSDSIGVRKCERCWWWEQQGVTITLAIKMLGVKNKLISLILL